MKVVQSGACKPLEDKKDSPHKQHDVPVTRTGLDFELSYSVKSEKTLVHWLRGTVTHFMCSCRT